ncbi:hypothetical protein C8R44DRAFT_781339 [Mycena epipterygia]|nr:hypothetical protein C8R44DRAFT_781339 [Mycena epipterygia]
MFLTLLFPCPLSARVCVPTSWKNSPTPRVQKSATTHIYLCVASRGLRASRSYGPVLKAGICLQPAEHYNPGLAQRNSTSHL